VGVRGAGLFAGVVRGVRRGVPVKPFDVVRQLHVRRDERAPFRRALVGVRLRLRGPREPEADSFRGVQKAFAIQAGREIRILVQENQVNDGETVVLARDIARKIEEQLTYPGQIRVTVIREKRAVDYAK